MSSAARQIAAIARLTVWESLSPRFVLLLAALLAAAFAVALFAGELAVTETRAVQTALLAAALRLGAVLLLGLWLISAVVREADDQVLAFLFALPLSRGAYCLGRLLGGAVVGLLVALPAGLVLLPFAPAPAVGLWAASLTLELWLTAAVALALGLAFLQITPAFIALLAFYLLGRALAAIELMAHSGLMEGGGWTRQVVVHLVDALALVLPDLSAYGRSEWLVYPGAGDSGMGALLTQTVLYLLLLGGVAVFDLYRKNF
ncbi:MAG TPA: ABC transporter permease [Gammaproteobacteria bacterium]|nr:ABC transporter permease [Gammaproteobacteria bacterium]